MRPTSGADVFGLATANGLERALRNFSKTGEVARFFVGQ